MVDVQQARLARIEAALVQSKGLLRCLVASDLVPPEWMSQVEEKQEMLSVAALDVIQMSSESVMTDVAQVL